MARKVKIATDDNGEPPRADRFSDGGIVMAGDEVITDTEAEHYGAESLVGTKRPMPPGMIDDTDIEEDDA